MLSPVFRWGSRKKRRADKRTFGVGVFNLGLQGLGARNGHGEAFRRLRDEWKIPRQGKNQTPNLVLIVHVGLGMVACVLLPFRSIFIFRNYIWVPLVPSLFPIS